MTVPSLVALIWLLGPCQLPPCHIPVSLFVVRIPFGGGGLYVVVVSVQAEIQCSTSFTIFNLCVGFSLTLSLVTLTVKAIFTFN